MGIQLYCVIGGKLYLSGFWRFDSRNKRQVVSRSAYQATLGCLHCIVKGNVYLVGVCNALRLQTGAQYSAGAYTRARADVRKVLKEAPHLVPVQKL